MSPDEFKRLKQEAPAELGEKIRQLRHSYSFAVDDQRQAFERNEWGGEFRVMLNRNVVIHLVPRFHAEMDEKQFLPQWTLFLDEERGGELEVNKFEGFDDLDPYWGVIWYLRRAEYEAIRKELSDLSEGYGDFPLLPDGLIAETTLHKVLNDRVLEHPLVKNEALFEGSRVRF